MDVINSLDFNSNILSFFQDGILNIFGREIFIQEHIFYSYVIVVILSIFCIYTGNKVKKANPRVKPTGVVWFGEFFVNMINKFTLNNLGEKKLGLAPYIGTLSMFLVASNYSGLIGFYAPTSDYNVTLTLALITIVLAQIYNIKSKGVKNYLHSYLEPFAFMLPSNLLDVVVTPISMSLRLFGNILAGSLILGLVYSALGFLSVVVTPFLHGYFDLFAGGVQAFVFVMLTAVTIDG